MSPKSSLAFTFGTVRQNPDGMYKANEVNSSIEDSHEILMICMEGKRVLAITAI